MATPETRDRGVVDDLGPCLSDLAHNLARKLVDLRLDVPNGWDFSEEREDKLKAHNGKYLPVVKEKLPIRSKAAMLSVFSGALSSSGNSVAVGHLDPHALELIFGFAATAARRSVTILRDSDRFSSVVMDG